MKNTMVKNKTLLASAILALTAVSSVAYAAAPAQKQHVVNLTAEITPDEFYVKPKDNGGLLAAEYKLAYDPVRKELAAATIEFSHKNSQGNAITATLANDAQLQHKTSSIPGDVIPLTVTYGGKTIVTGTSTDIAIANAPTLIAGEDADLVITPASLASISPSVSTGEYAGTVTINFDSSI